MLERIRAVTTYVHKDAKGFQVEWMRCRHSQHLKSIQQEGLRFEINALESMIAVVETQTIVNEFVKKMIVSAPDQSRSKRRQRIKIIFNFVGHVNIPILTDAPTVDPKYIHKSKGAA